MKYYQILEVAENKQHAGTKATADISAIATKLGFQAIRLIMRNTNDSKIAKVQRQIGYYKDWNKIYKTIEENSIVLLQHPFHYPQLTREKTLEKLKKKKKIRFISLIHDVEELRQFRYNNYYKREFEFMLEIANVFVVHNKVMADFFVDRGIAKDKIVILEIFDYLQRINTSKLIFFNKTVNIAGNLDTVKCGYLKGLFNLKTININLFGPNFSEKIENSSNIHYKGCFSTDEVVNQLNEGFGLVWDGDSINGCLGQAGQYLKYNNPHKLSLYLSSGLPVVIWKGAAEAEFVKKYNIGICVESLAELEVIFDLLTEKKYQELLNNVNNVSKKLIKGFYGEKSLREAINRIERENI